MTAQLLELHFGCKADSCRLVHLVAGYLIVPVLVALWLINRPLDSPLRLGLIEQGTYQNITAASMLASTARGAISPPARLWLIIPTTDK